MPDLTDEELQTKIQEAIDKEHRSIAGDQFFREAMMSVAQKVSNGIYDSYVFEVGAEMYDEFKKNNPLTRTKKKEKPSKKKKEEDD
jgi:hypothetical protein